MNNYQLVNNEEWKEVEINGEVKEIPMDWDIDKLNNLCDVRDGTHESPKFLDNGIPFVTTKNLMNGKIDFTSAKFISKENYEDYNRRSKVDNGDILLGMIGTVGNPVMVKNKIFDFSIKNLGLIKTKNKINQNFLFFEFTKTIEEQKQKSDGGVLKFMTLGVLREIQIYYPSENQQSSIASILSSQESIIQDIESLISKYESRFQYLSEELLSGRLRVKEVDGQTVLYKNADDNWKEVEVNGEMKEIPRDWDIFSLKDFGIVKTSSVDKKFKEGEQIVDLFNYMDVYRSTTKLVDKNIKFTKTSIKPHVLEDNSIKKNDVFFTPSSETDDDIGHSATAIEDIPNAVYSYHLIRFRPTKLLLNSYFSGKLFNTLHCKTYFTEKCNGLTRMTLRKSDFEDLQIYFPEITEQENIYSVISQQEFLVKKYKQLLTKEKQKFDWLLDNLLSGKYLVQEQ